MGSKVKVKENIFQKCGRNGRSIPIDCSPSTSIYIPRYTALYLNYNFNNKFKKMDVLIMQALVAIAPWCLTTCKLQLSYHSPLLDAVWISLYMSCLLCNNSFVYILAGSGDFQKMPGRNEAVACRCLKPSFVRHVCLYHRVL